MNLPRLDSLSQLVDRWKSILDPALSTPLINGQLLSNVALANGATVVNHGLGRKLIGWQVVGVSAAATIYDTQATNQRPDLYLNLTSSAACTVNLWVF